MDCGDPGSALDSRGKVAADGRSRREVGEGFALVPESHRDSAAKPNGCEARVTLGGGVRQIPTPRWGRIVSGVDGHPGNPRRNPLSGWPDHKPRPG